MFICLLLILSTFVAIDYYCFGDMFSAWDYNFNSFIIFPQIITSVVCDYVVFKKKKLIILPYLWERHKHNNHSVLCCFYNSLYCPTILWGWKCRGSSRTSVVLSGPTLPCIWYFRACIRFDCKICMAQKILGQCHADFSASKFLEHWWHYYFSLYFSNVLLIHKIAKESYALLKICFMMIFLRCQIQSNYYAKWFS